MVEIWDVFHEKYQLGHNCKPINGDVEDEGFDEGLGDFWDGVVTSVGRGGINCL